MSTDKSIPAIQRKASVLVGKRRTSTLAEDESEFRQRMQNSGVPNASATEIWQDSATAKACVICSDKFTLTNRKHHCRQCGDVICGKCSNHQLAINGDLKRACITCYNKAVANKTIEDDTGFGSAKNHSHSASPYASKPTPVSIPQSVAVPVLKTPELSIPADPKTELPAWAETLLYISKIGSRPVSVIQYPKCSLSEDSLSNIVSNAIPLGKIQDGNFMFRIQQQFTSESDTSYKNVPNAYFNCYTSLRQAIHPQVNSFAVVFVSRWTFPQLGFRLVGKLEEAILSQIGSSYNESVSSVVLNMLMVAYSQVILWPTPKPDSSMSLPFLGELFQYSMIPSVWKAFYGGVSLIPSQVTSNLIALFGPVGLIPKMWTVWEMLVTGQNVVVYSDSPARCSQFTIALATILAPLDYLGDLRPFVTSSDTEINALRHQASEHQSIRKSINDQASRSIRKMSILVGTNEVEVVETLNTFDAAIFLSNPPVGSSDVDVVYLGLRKKNIANFKVKPNGTTLSSLLSDWISSGKGNSLIVSSAEPASYQDSNIVKKIKVMNAKERLIIGEKLLRDNLSTLTMAYLKPSEDSSVEAEDLKHAEDVLQIFVSSREEEIKRAKIKPKASGLLGHLDDLALFLRTSPELALSNVPTLILWFGYLSFLSIYNLVGFPLIAIIVLIFIVKIPVECPQELEDQLKIFIPEPFLYPLKNPEEIKTPESSSLPSLDSNKPLSTEVSTSSSPVDYSGVWKRVKCVNYENFLGAQGVGYVQRRLAATITMMHIITMDTAFSAFRLQEKAGPIDSDNLYEINQEKQKTSSVGKKEFIDRVYWENGVLVIHKVIMPDKSYELTVRRYLENGGKTIRLVAVFHDLVSPTAKLVETTCYFEKQGPSPNEPPKSFSVPLSEQQLKPSGIKPIIDDTAHVNTKKYTDFTGIWQRTKAVNFDEFVGVQGAGYMQRKLAASLSLTHTIVMNPSLSAMRLKEVGGPLDLDNTYTIGNDFIETKILKKDFKDKAYWLGPSALVLHRVVGDGSFELVLTRKLYDDGNQIILSSLHRDLRTMKETIATSWFKKIGVPALPAPVPVPLPENAKIDLEDEMMPPEDVDEDDDADDDSAALLKQRIRSTNRQTTLLAISDLILEDEPEVTLDPHFAGKWERQDDKSMKDMPGNMSVVHVIKYPSPTSVQIIEISGNQTTNDRVFSVNADAIPTETNGKKYRERLYFEGGQLVHEKSHDGGDFEYVYKRYIEDGGNTIRLATIYRNLVTGEDSESLSIFSRIKE